MAKSLLEPEVTTEVAKVTPTEVVRIEPQRDTSPEAMLMLAIDKGMTADGLAKLVELQMLVRRERAESAFNLAMAAFSEECPPILKNREAFDNVKNKHLYNFADLPQVMRIIDPVLHRNGLSYTFDCDMTGDVVTTTCHVHHVDGHSRSSKFCCNATGTSIMSQPQKAASATTFGKRYSLQGALGLCFDEDDDAQSVTPPPEGPRHDDTKPQTQPRGQRATKEDCESLWNDWRAATGGEFSAYVDWAAKITAMTPDQVIKVASWTKQAIDHCRDALAREQR